MLEQTRNELILELIDKFNIARWNNDKRAFVYAKRIVQLTQKEQITKDYELSGLIIPELPYQQMKQFISSLDKALYDYTQQYKLPANLDVYIHAIAYVYKIDVSVYYYNVRTGMAFRFKHEYIPFTYAKQSKMVFLFYVRNNEYNDKVIALMEYYQIEDKSRFYDDLNNYLSGYTINNDSSVIDFIRNLPPAHFKNIVKAEYRQL